MNGRSYEQVRESMLDAIGTRGPLTPEELEYEVVHRVGDGPGIGHLFDRLADAEVLHRTTDGECGVRYELGAHATLYTRKG